MTGVQTCALPIYPIWNDLAAVMGHFGVPADAAEVLILQIVTEVSDPQMRAAMGQDQALNHFADWSGVAPMPEALRPAYAEAVEMVEAQMKLWTYMHQHLQAVLLGRARAMRQALALEAAGPTR